MKRDQKIRNILMKITKNEEPKIWDKKYQFSPGDLDSLDMATLALTLEESFEIKIADEDLSNLLDINSIEKYIEKYLGHE